MGSLKFQIRQLAFQTKMRRRCRWRILTHETDISSFICKFERWIGVGVMMMIERLKSKLAMLSQVQTTQTYHIAVSWHARVLRRQQSRQQLHAGGLTAAALFVSLMYILDFEDAARGIQTQGGMPCASLLQFLFDESPRFYQVLPPVPARNTYGVLMIPFMNLGPRRGCILWDLNRVTQRPLWHCQAQSIRVEILVERGFLAPHLLTKMAESPG